MRQTKLCFVIDRLALRSGGAERVLIETANALHDAGYSIEIVTHEQRGKPPFYPLRPGILRANLRPANEQRGRIRRMIDRLRMKWHRSEWLPYGLRRLKWLSMHGGFKSRLGRHIDATQPDAVIAFLPPSVTALGLARFTHRPRLFASLHNVPSQDFDNPQRWDPNPVDRSFRRAALDRYDAIGILLPEFQDWFPEHLRARLLVVPNAVQPVRSDLVRQAIRDNTVISVGRLAEVKQHRLLIEAWAYLKDDFPDWTCKIYGIGPMQEELSELICKLGLTGHVSLMGDTREIEKVYLSASILAHPAKFEGFGLVITEALAHGVPVVGFEDCSGFNFIVKDGTSGLFVNGEGDRARNLSKVLARLMCDPRRQENLRAGGLREVERFAPERILALWKLAIHGPTEHAAAKFQGED
ncbi:glycosyltransferase [Celeribacter neptunius]|uniref:Glycosyltransferase involved in cell wall bisynthesis n=1 Tax=Celeribacter neptunius TaxID=588602 RepID=A0A1I3SVZ4_9RHOB|nr:glycosyltransferase [Celeribacter neptunius]SFJ62560.1 Glycosyltransferase involved in cell wall bisynthesis [Celeribacter neptunius]